MAGLTVIVPMECKRRRDVSGGTHTGRRSVGRRRQARSGKLTRCGLEPGVSDVFPRKEGRNCWVCTGFRPSARFPPHETIAIAIAAAAFSEETDTRWGREPKKMQSHDFEHLFPFRCLIVPAPAQLRLPPRLGSW